MSGEAARAADVRAENEAQERADLIEQIEAAIADALDNHGQAGTSWVGAVECQRCECGHVEPYGLGLGEHQIRQAALAVLPLVEDAGSDR